METEYRKYKRYSRLLKYLIVISGLWPDIPPIVQPLIGYVSAFASFITAAALLNFSIHYITNVAVLTKSFGLVMSFLAIFVKVCTFLWHHDDLVYLNKVLHMKFEEDTQNESYRPLTLSRVNFFANFFYTLSFAIGLTTSMASVIFIVSLSHGKYAMVYPSIFPFHYEPGGCVYWILIAIESFGNFFCWTVNSGVDSLFGWYTMQMCGEFRVLAHKFRNLRSSTNYRDDLRECVERHHMLMKIKFVLQDVFGFLVIYIVITAAIIICTIIFQITQIMKNFGLNIIFILGYIVLKLVQAYILAYYGQLIFDEVCNNLLKSRQAQVYVLLMNIMKSELCIRAIYEARWAGLGDVSFMKDIVIVLSQNPLTFRAASCMSLKMDIFTKVLNTSISYFFLLQTLDESA